MSQTKHVRFSLVVCLLALLVPMSMFGQSSSGSISGTVADETGAVLPGVTITATNIATGVNRMTVSNSVGHYQIGLVPPGMYRVAGELSGFQPAKVESVVVNVGSDAGLDLKLRAGLAETVTVTASAPLVETTKSEVSTVVNQTSIENLPTNGRNFIDFVLTTPGVVKDVRGGDISFAGQRGTLNSLVVDRTRYSYNATTRTLTPTVVYQEGNATTLGGFQTPTLTAGQRVVQLAAKVTF